MLATRDKIIALAEELIRTKGYNAFSYRDIAERLNIKNAAIHHYFRSKGDLGKAVIIQTQESFQQQTEVWEELNPKEKLMNFIQVYQNSQLKSWLCFMGALGPAYETLPEVMQIELTSASHEIRSWLRKTLREGMDQGFFHFKESPEQKTDLIITAYLSSLILSRVTKENLFESVNQAILQGL